MRLRSTAEGRTMVEGYSRLTQRRTCPCTTLWVVPLPLWGRI